MQQYFYELADHLTSKLRGDEVFTSDVGGEDSDFVRLNQNKVRQAGRVQQLNMGIDLIRGGHHAEGSSSLTRDREEDHRRLDTLVADLRAKLDSLVEDPHLHYATEVRSTETIGQNNLPPGDAAVSQILKAGQGRDLVGIYSSGGIFRGFANSLGQRNWYTTYTYNFDWSLYHHQDKAVKNNYAGFTWESDAFEAKMSRAFDQLGVLEREPRTISPGEYSVYLAPAALYDYLGMLGWDGYGLKAHRTKQTTLIKMVAEDARLHPQVTIAENTSEGVAPNFQSKGFLRPDRVTLIEGGCFRNCMVSPRSAKEYGVATNGANASESPESLDVAAGEVPADGILERLGTGLLINNLWYLNYSDRPACRITGLTRFACFWVERGKIVAPLNVMRFDETVFRAMGRNLVGLTSERDVILDAETYGGRSTVSARMPGALIENFRFNL